MNLWDLEFGCFEMLDFSVLFTCLTDYVFCVTFLFDFLTPSTSGDK